jgi:type I restriction enzyme, S subunit
MRNIPSRWKLCKLGDVIRLRNGFAFKSSDYSEEGIPVIRISDIGDGRVSIENTVRIPKEKAKFEFTIEPGDLLIAMSDATTGKTGVYEGKEQVLQN